MTVSSLALAAGGIFAVSAMTPASAATTTASPQTQTAVFTSDDWGGWRDHGDWGGWC
jgi:hypothetical protein